MKLKELCKQYGLEVDPFREWIKTTDFKFTSGVMGGIDIDESQDIPAMVAQFKAYEAEKAARLADEHAKEQERLAKEEAEAQLAEQRKQQALASMLITSGFEFDGYRISKYSGYISGDDAISINRPSYQGFWEGTSGDASKDLLQSLAQIRRNALAKLKENAYALGCNAVIGVDFDYISLDPATGDNKGGTIYLPFVFAVTANGNAVMIEPDKST